jgi:hypothetical protein
MNFKSKHSSGSAMLMIMIAVVLMAALTYAVTRSQQGAPTLSRENVSLAVDQVEGFGLNLKRAAENMTRAGNSETAISFASADLTGYGTPDTAPATEVFNIQGGGVAYMSVPANISDGSQWEFSGSTAAPQIGDDGVPDLMMILPNVSESFCRAYNEKAGYAADASIPTDSAACLYDTSARFTGTFAADGDINTMDAASFRKPAPFACVACGSAYHAYYVLLER